MTVAEFINTQPAERQPLMTALNEAVLANDNNVSPVIEPMMGKEMIIYKDKCYMKYGLAGVKKHMSLHCLPIYMNPALHSKYEALLPDAKVQKGCINFTDASEMPIAITADLIAECSRIDIAEMLEKRKKK